MRIGLTLPELAKQITRERDERKDFVAPTTLFKFRAIGERGSVNFSVGKNTYLVEPTRHCQRQICSRAGIPAPYADRCMQAEGGLGLLADNINWWWKNAPEKRMLRTLMNGHQTGRAFLSDRYRPLDNYDLAECVLPILQDAGCEVISSQITETRLYIQAATPRLQADVNRIADARAKGLHTRINEIVQAGAIISNSEVGQGALNIDPMLYFLVCLNGLVLPRVIRRHHIGRRQDPLFELDSASEYYTDKTRQQDDKAFWMKVSDVVRGLFDKDRFDHHVQQIADTKEQKLESGTKAVEVVTERFKFDDHEKEGVLNHLIEGGDLSLFGLINAVTRTADDCESYDRAVEFERFGGQILELPKSTWN